MLLLGLDIGTSSTKAIVLDGRGRIVAAGSAGHPIRHPHPGWSEQDPRNWWRSACEAVRLALAGGGGAGTGPGRPIRGDEIAAVGVSGQMHGAVLVDRATVDSGGASDDVLRPALLWNDQRTGAQCRWIEERAGGRAALVRLVGNAALPGFTLPKWLWVKEHEPDVWARVAALMMPKDYVRFRMTGQVATDAGDGAGTLVFDVDRRGWSAAAASLFGIELALLPPVLEAGAAAGSLTAFAAAALGLRTGTPVIAGSGDNQCGAIGAGVVEPGLILATLGTSGVVYAHADQPRRDLGRLEHHPRVASLSDGRRAVWGASELPEISGSSFPTSHPSPRPAEPERGLGAGPGPSTPAGRVHTMCAADGSAAAAGHWSITGCTLSAGGSLAWAREHVFGGAAYGTLLTEAAAAPPGSEGLLFLPYLTGERCPHPDPAASGGWIGLTARHARGHMVRAVLEGVALTMAQILGIMRSIGIDARACRLGGGGTRSDLWRDILTAAMNVRTQTMETQEGPAYGAALLAGVGVGAWSGVAAACRETIRVAAEHEPGAELVQRYEAMGPVHARAYEGLRGVMGELAGFR